MTDGNIVAVHGCVACREGQSSLQFSMAFQPIVDVAARRIDAYEALVRGSGGEGAAHVLGQVHPGNLYAFDQSCRVRAIEMAAALGVDRRLNINFLPNAVYDPRACIRLTLDAARRHGFPLDRITFEIFEREGLADTSHLAAIIDEYRRCGFKIALDDFGTGFSGLSRLADLKPDIVKIDRALAKDCDRDATRRVILASTLALCDQLGIKTVIEGVERTEEVVALRDVGARFMQGYYFARPIFEGIVGDGDIVWPDDCAGGDDDRQLAARRR